MAQEAIYETGKRKQRTAKAGKASEQPTGQAEHDENTVGWEEQMWMNQAGATTDITDDETSDAWQAAEMPTPEGAATASPMTVPTLDTLRRQLSQVQQLVGNGLQALLGNSQGSRQGSSPLQGSVSDARRNDLYDDHSLEELKRWSSLIGGGLLALVGLRRSLGSLTIMTIGAGLVYYALTGQRLLPGAQQQRGRLTAPQRGRTGTSSLDSNRPLTVKNILIKAPLHEVYSVWANFENFPSFMQHIRSVTKSGERTSHWVMDGPLHSRLEWDAETTRLEEDSRIAWSSTSGDIKTSGQVTFNALSNDEVEVTVMLRYIPPAGIAGDLVAALFVDPEGKLEEDLRNFKRYIEKSGTVIEGADI